MAQTGFTPILVYASGTATNVPLAANLTSSASGAELALNYADGKLYFKNSSGVVTLLASSATVAPVTTFSAGATGFTPSSATFGAVTLAGTLATTNGGTGLTSFTANGVVYASSSSALTTGSALTFDGTILGNALTANATYSELLRLRNNGVGDGTGAKLSFNFSGTERGYVGATYSSGWITDLSGTDATRFLLSGSEQMRLTSTGLGIGTSSPDAKLDVLGSSSDQIRVRTAETEFYRFGRNSSTGFLDFYGSQTGYQGYTFGGVDGTWATINSSGNLGLGVTPSAWGSSFNAIQIKTGAGWMADGANSYFSANSYWNGTNWIRNLANAAARYQMESGAHSWYTAAGGTAGNAISFTQAMTLDASGNLALGQTSASFRFDVLSGADVAVRARTSNSNEVLRVESTGTSVSAIRFVNTAANGTYISADNAALAFLTGSTERARIDSSGNLLVGTTNAAENAGSGMKVLNTGGTVALVSTASDASQQGFEMYSTTAAAYRLYINYAGTINATSTTISAISDQRLKENIQDLDVGLDKIMALKPRKFDWKTGKGKDIKGDRGWIAQEFEQVFPDLIDEWRDPAPEGEEPYKSVRADLIPILVKAIQELKAEFDAYKATHP